MEIRSEDTEKPIPRVEIRSEDTEKPIPRVEIWSEDTEKPIPRVEKRSEDTEKPIPRVKTKSEEKNQGRNCWVKEVGKEGKNQQENERWEKKESKKIWKTCKESDPKSYSINPTRYEKSTAVSRTNKDLNRPSKDSKKVNLVPENQPENSERHPVDEKGIRVNLTVVKTVFNPPTLTASTMRTPRRSTIDLGHKPSQVVWV